METERVKVDGVTFNVYTERLSGWHAFRLLSHANELEDNYAKVNALVEIACYITGLSEDEFIQKCGGDDAQVQHVVQVVIDLVQKAYPKN